jgi:hypothetical protein
MVMQGVTLFMIQSHILSLLQWAKLYCAPGQGSQLLGRQQRENTPCPAKGYQGLTCPSVLVRLMCDSRGCGDPVRHPSIIYGLGRSLQSHHLTKTRPGRLCLRWTSSVHLSSVCDVGAAALLESGAERAEVNVLPNASCTFGFEFDYVPFYVYLLCTVRALRSWR